MKTKTKLPKSYIKIIHLLKQEPTFENLCIYMANKDKKQTTEDFMEDMWWLWCETYPRGRKSLITFEEKDLNRILKYII